MLYLIIDSPKLASEFIRRKGMLLAWLMSQLSNSKDGTIEPEFSLFDSVLLTTRNQLLHSSAVGRTIWGRGTLNGVGDT